MRILSRVPADGLAESGLCPLVPVCCRLRAEPHVLWEWVCSRVTCRWEDTATPGTALTRTPASTCALSRDHHARETPSPMEVMGRTWLRASVCRWGCQRLPATCGKAVHAHQGPALSCGVVTPTPERAPLGCGSRRTVTAGQTCPRSTPAAPSPLTARPLSREQAFAALGVLGNYLLRDKSLG